MRIFISVPPRTGAAGGGSGTFSWNFHRYLEERRIPFTRLILRASKAIVIADKVNWAMLWLAKKAGCRIIHRLDEHIEPGESAARRKKHEGILRLNRLADVTVFQSEFCRENVLPYLSAKNWTVIHNGGDTRLFRDEGGERSFIGHVSNSVGDKKRLELLEKAIQRYPDERFLLVGNHPKADIDFSRYPNVTMTGPVRKTDLPQYYQKMKCLYFPSEKDPCPNTVVEAVLSGVPVCYNPIGGTVELVQDCGLPLDQFDQLLRELPQRRKNCAVRRKTLDFDHVARKYLEL